MKPETNNELGEGVRMSHVFLIVLALHVLIIGGAFAFHWVRADQMDQVAQKNPTEHPVDKMTPEDMAPESDELASKEDEEIEPVVDASVEPGVQLATKMRGGDQPMLREGVAAAPAPEVALRKVPTQPVAAVAQAKTSGTAASYKVVKGDTLSKISRVSGVSISQIRAANAMSTDALRIGQVLKIPGGASAPKAVASAPAPLPVSEEVAPVASAPVAAASAVANSGETYTVSKGDTLVRIAKKFGTTAGELMQVNNITDPSKLGIGTKLVLPRPTSAAQQENIQKNTKARSAEELAMNKH